MAHYYQEIIKIIASLEQIVVIPIWAASSRTWLYANHEMFQCHFHNLQLSKYLFMVTKFTLVASVPKHVSLRRGMLDPSRPSSGLKTRSPELAANIICNQHFYKLIRILKIYFYIFDCNIKNIFLGDTSTFLMFVWEWTESVVRRKVTIALS